jgi:hypothetical protein
MKTTKQPISSNTFFYNLFRTILIDLQNKEAVKRARLILFVLLCILIKSILIMPEKNTIRQNKQRAISAQGLKFSFGQEGLFLKTNFRKKQSYYQRKARSVRFNTDKKSINSYVVN